MATATLTIDPQAIASNWRALDKLSTPGTQTAAVVKANAYGLGLAPVARALAVAGARRFFVALAEEGTALRQVLGPGPQINVLSGHMEGDTEKINGAALTPMLNSIEQLTRHLEALPERPFGVHLDTGMNRLGLEPAEWRAAAGLVIQAEPEILISHLACADQPDHPMNARQLALFHALTDGLPVPRSFAATGGILLGPAYHFDLTRPGIGLYGGAPFKDAAQVVRLDLPIIQARVVAEKESIGYAMSWTAPEETIVATVAAGYADGIFRTLSNRAQLWHGAVPCPVLGRISMDLITVDVTHLGEIPDTLALLCAEQTIDDLAQTAGTIGYEILTSLGNRYDRQYVTLHVGAGG